MPSAPKQRGVVVDQKGRTRNIMKRRRNRQRSVFMLAFVIFAFLSPQAREAAFGTVDNLDEYLAQLLEGPRSIHRRLRLAYNVILRLKTT